MKKKRCSHCKSLNTQKRGAYQTEVLTIHGKRKRKIHKITDCHGFEYADTAWNCLKLIIMNYRFHKFTCSRINGHNGKSPLSLAGVNSQGINWIKFSQKNAH